EIQHKVAAYCSPVYRTSGNRKATKKGRYVRFQSDSSVLVIRRRRWRQVRSGIVLSMRSEWSCGFETQVKSSTAGFVSGDFCEGFSPEFRRPSGTSASMCGMYLVSSKNRQKNTKRTASIP